MMTEGEYQFDDGAEEGESGLVTVTHSPSRLASPRTPTQLAARGILRI